MKIDYILFAAFAVCLLSVHNFGQTLVEINDPAFEPVKTELSKTDKVLFEKNILPAARKRLASEVCEESAEPASPVQGSFTKSGSKQTLIAYQFCETGNGIGSVGVAVIENGKVVANVVSVDSGTAINARTLPDINQNGRNEVALSYSGGMHQGGGGTGVDILEFSPNGALNGIGWFQAEEYSESSPVMGYRVLVKPGKVPSFSRQKYVQNAAGKWRKTGKPMPLKLSKTVSEFESIK